MVNDDVVEAYSKIASVSYDHPINSSILYGSMTRKYIEKIEFTDEKTLDLGCGTGFIVDCLLKRKTVLPGFWIGIDPATGMLKRAIAKHGQVENLHYLAASAESLPIADQSIDLVISTFSLHWVSSPRVAFSEINRVLRPGGRIRLLFAGRHDGAKFKTELRSEMAKRISLSAILKAASRIQRLDRRKVELFLAPFQESHRIVIEELRATEILDREALGIVLLARSSPILQEIDDLKLLIDELCRRIEESGKQLSYDVQAISVSGDPYDH